MELPARTIQTGGSLDISGIMWAGAAKCETFRGTNVGTAAITVSAKGYVVDFNLNDDCYVKDLHVWVSNTKPSSSGGFGDKYWYKSESK